MMVAGFTAAGIAITDLFSWVVDAADNQELENGNAITTELHNSRAGQLAKNKKLTNVFRIKRR
jgi:hypothetical protein